MTFNAIKVDKITSSPLFDSDNQVDYYTVKNVVCIALGGQQKSGLDDTRLSEYGMSFFITAEVRITMTLRSCVAAS